MPQLKAATGLIANAYYRQPSGALQVVATTGTNGKTSTAWWTAQCLTQLGTRCGVVGTLGIGEPPVPGQVEAKIEFTGLTTPDPVLLQAGFRHMVDQGFGACAIEASSIGIVEQRLAGTAIEVVRDARSGMAVKLTGNDPHERTAVCRGQQRHLAGGMS